LAPSTAGPSTIGETMEDIVELLKNIIPAVIVIASLVLPAFVKKKKEEKKNAQKGARGLTSGTAPQKKAAQADLESKVRKYFNEMKSAKKPAAQQKPAGQQPTTLQQPGLAQQRPGAQQRPSRPSVAEPAILSSRDKVTPTPKPKKGSPPVSEPRQLSTLAKAKPNEASDDAYSVDVDAYRSDTNAYATDTDAGSAERLSAMGQRGEALTSFGRGEKPLSTISEKTPAPKRRTDWDLTLDAESLSVSDLRKAIILREVLGPPVALKGFISD